MTDERTAARYGRAELTPTGDVVVGTHHTWTLTYTVGEMGMDDGAALKVAFSQTTDWGTPQFENPRVDNYATVETSGDATVSGEYQSSGHVRPFKYAVRIDVTDGAIDPGETITLVLGDRSGGSMGQFSQTFPETDFELKVLVDPVRTGEFVELPESLTFDFVSGAATRLCAVLPADVDPGEEATLSVRVEDYWGNAAKGFSGRIDVVDSDGLYGPDGFEVRDGVGRTTVEPPETGIYRPRVASGSMTARSNPMRVGGEETVYWGDIHGQSGETVGTGTVQQYFEYADEYAFVDFVSHAGNDFQITDDFWQTLTETVHAFNEPGELVTFLCYEWSANTPAGGDHNVYFRGDQGELRRSSNWQTAEGAARWDGTRPIEELYEQFRGRDDVLVIPHQGGRPASLDVYDADLTPFIEIASVWGVFEWFAKDALERGYEVGFVGGSDDHTGRPGATPPDNLSKHNVQGGLLAAFADELTRESLWEAFTERAVYGTTGARILLDVDVAGASTGERVTVNEPVSVRVTAHGTSPVREVTLYGGTERIGRRTYTDGEDVIELTWTGAKGRGRDKVVDWSGGVTLHDGRLVDVEAFGFHRPNQGVTERTPNTIRWTSTTTGNYHGVRLRVDASADAELSVSTGPVSERLVLSDLGEETFDAGSLDTRLIARRTGRSTAFDVEATFDDDPDVGLTPYWVRIRQDDGEMAWSSPVFVERREG